MLFIRLLWVLFGCLAMWPTLAAAQMPMPGFGGEDQPAVRLADDPRANLERTRKLLLEKQQGLLLRGQDVTIWSTRQTELAERRAKLVERRKTLIRSAPPSLEERSWVSDYEMEVVPEIDAGPPPPDAARPDGGIADGGIADGGIADGGIADGDVTEAGLPHDAQVVDAAPPKMRKRQSILPVLSFGEGKFLAPGVHPAEVEELDSLIQAIDAMSDTLASLGHLHNEERLQLAESVSRADAMLRAMDAERKKAKEEAEGKAAKDDDKDPEIIGLRETEKRALKVHLARIELSLARAQHRGSDGSDEDAAIRESAPLEPIRSLEEQGIEPIEAFTASHSRAQAMRRATQARNREHQGFQSTVAMLRTEVKLSRKQRNALERQTAEREMKNQESALDDALKRMQITPAELEWAQSRYERSVTLRQKGIPDLEKKLGVLREAGVTRHQDDLSAAQLREVKRTLIGEKLVFERLKLQRDTFRRDMAVALEKILRGVEPGAEFRETHESILNIDTLKNRQDDLETRCDGWRRAENTASRTSVTGENVQNRTLILKAYAGLSDVCMREEWVLSTQERLSQIAQFHLKRLEWHARGFTWYLWRVLVSLIFVGFVFFLSMWIGRLTRRVAGQMKEAAHDHKSGVEARATSWRSRLRQVRSVSALLLYLSGIAALWLGAIMLCSRAVWGFPVELDSLIGWATYPVAYVSDRPVSLWSLAQVFGWAIVAVWVGRPVQTFISESLLEHFAIERGIRDAAGTFARYLVVFAGIVAGLASVGIGLESLAVIIGVLSFGIGFGLQNIVANFISGFILLLERPIQKGDYIEVDGMIGEVKHISARATIIETRDAVSVFVPNSALISERVINWTRGQHERVRLHVNVGVAYGTDVAKVERLMLDLAREHPDVLHWPPPTFRLLAFGDSSLDVVLNVWTRKLREMPTVISELNRAVDRSFRAHDIEIPFPQRDVNLRTPTDDPEQSEEPEPKDQG